MEETHVYYQFRLPSRRTKVADSLKAPDAAWRAPHWRIADLGFHPSPPTSSGGDHHLNDVCRFISNPGYSPRPAVSGTIEVLFRRDHRGFSFYFFSSAKKSTT